MRCVQRRACPRPLHLNLLPPPTPLINYLESMAEWFADELGDGLNGFDLGLLTPFPRIMEEGIAESVDRDNTYHRWLFFKLLDQSCTDFRSHLDELLGKSNLGLLLLDLSAIQQLKDVIGRSSCDFGDHFGASRAGNLEAAIAYYNYITLFKKDIKLIDDNEARESGFRGAPNAMVGLYEIPPIGAYSLNIPSFKLQQEDYVAELIVESDKPVFVSVTSMDDGFDGLNTIGVDNDEHEWFVTHDRAAFEYKEEGVAPDLFVTVVNPSVISYAKVNVEARAVYRKTTNTVYPIVTSHAHGQEVSNRLVTISGAIPQEVQEDASDVVLSANGLKSKTAMRLDGTFEGQVVVLLGDNIITVQGFDGRTPVTGAKVITLEGVEGTANERNQLVPSRVGFVLRWDTNGTDADLYSTDKDDDAIWYSGKVQDPGFLDIDDVSGFGPEIISYRSPAHDVYVKGTFDVDVHYYGGSPATNFILDVILNETDGNNRRLHHYKSVASLTSADGIASNGPNGQSGPSRFNDILRVTCSGQGVCLVDRFDENKLAPAAEIEASRSASHSVATDRDALVALYNATDGDNWRDNTNWLSDAPLGRWYGVTTDSDGRVTKLVLPRNDLSGEMPEELGQLRRLTHLVLWDNDLSGEIPEALGDLSELVCLSLWSNDLTGEIPEKLGDLSNLTQLDLLRNDLDGSIPSSLGDLSNLTRLHLAENDLSGTIPSSLGDLINLESLYLFRNELEGRIPSSLANLTNLNWLYMSENVFTGCIPPGLRDVPYHDLGILALDDCAQQSTSGGETRDSSFVPRQNSDFDFDAEAEDISLASSPVYAGQRVAINARFQNLSPSTGPHGGAATFDVTIYVEPPTGTAERFSWDNQAFTLSQERTFTGSYTFASAGTYTVWAEIYDINGQQRRMERRQSV